MSRVKIEINKVEPHDNGPATRTSIYYGELMDTDNAVNREVIKRITKGMASYGGGNLTPEVERLKRRIASLEQQLQFATAHAIDGRL